MTKVRIVERPDGGTEFRIPTVGTMAESLIHELLSTSMRHLNDATDPDTPEACFRPYLLIGALAAQNAYLLDALVRRDPADAAAVVAELRDLAEDGEVLVSWVGEQLNTRDLP